MQLRLLPVGVATPIAVVLLALFVALAAAASLGPVVDVPLVAVAGTVWEGRTGHRGRAA